MNRPGRFSNIGTAATFVVVAFLGACSSGKDTIATKNGANGCPVNTGFEGDDACIGSTTEGLHLHYGPSDYDDPSDVALFTLEPGEEVSKCYFSKAPNTEDFYYSKMVGHLRPGSHHLIARALANRTETDGFHSCAATDSLGNPDDI